MISIITYYSARSVPAHYMFQAFAHIGVGTLLRSGAVHVASNDERSSLRTTLSQEGLPVRRIVVHAYETYPTRFSPCEILTQLTLRVVGGTLNFESGSFFILKERTWYAGTMVSQNPGARRETAVAYHFILRLRHNGRRCLDILSALYLAITAYTTPGFLPYATVALSQSYLPRGLER